MSTLKSTGLHCSVELKIFLKTYTKKGLELAVWLLLSADNRSWLLFDDVYKIIS